jgi:hypothetical protein
VISSPKGSVVWTGAVGGVAAAAGGVPGLGVGAAGEALAAGAWLAAGAGVGLATGCGEAAGAGEGVAEAAGAGLGDCASALNMKMPERPREMAAAGISAAKVRRKLRFILLFSPRRGQRPYQGPIQRLRYVERPGPREPRRSNT